MNNTLQNGYKNRLGIVVGDGNIGRLLPFCAALSHTFNVTILALDSHLPPWFQTSLNVKLYPSVPEMPGYMRELEHDVASLDGIIAIEPSRLATFQAVRLARKYGIPCLTLSLELEPFFYNSFANIHAITQDNLVNSDLLIAVTQRVERALICQNVPRTKVLCIDPWVDINVFKIDPQKRRKFRSYVGLEPDDRVILYHADLESPETATQILKCLRILVTAHSKDCENLRLIIVGEGPAARDLKYLSSDLKLGKRVLFLEQQALPFLPDLLNACDLQIFGRWKSTSKAQTVPFEVLESMTAGVIPIVPVGTAADDLIGGQVRFQVEDCVAHILAEKIFTIVTQDAWLALQTAVLGIGQRYLRADWVDGLSKIISDSIVRKRPEDARREYVEEFMRSVDTLPRKGREQEILSSVENFLASHQPEDKIKSNLTRIKGDAYYSLGEMEPAMQAYAQALELNDKNYEALRGLGYVAWKGYSHEEALSFFKRSMAVRPDDYQSILGIGLVYCRIKMHVEATFWLEKAVAVGGAECSAVTVLVQTCLENDDSDAAENVIRRMIDLVGEAPPLMRALGQLLINRGEKEQGAKMIQEAI